MDFTEGRPGKGGEWVMTTSAGEPMILPYDPPAWDPQSQNTNRLIPGSRIVPSCHPGWGAVSDLGGFRGQFC